MKKALGAWLTSLAFCVVVAGCGKLRALEEAEHARDEAVKRAEIAEQAASAAAAQVQVLQQAVERSNDDDARHDIEAALRARPVDDDASLIAAFQQKVTTGLKDPGSTQFRSAALNPGRSALCGEVNVKDDTGRYVGFRPFVASAAGSSVLDMTCDPGNLDRQMDCLKANLAYAQAAQSAGCVPTP